MTDNTGPTDPQPGNWPQGGPQQPAQPQQPGQPPYAGQPGQPQPPYAGQQQPGQPQPPYGQPQQPGHQQWQGQPPHGAAQPGPQGGGVNKKVIAAVIVVLLLVIGGIIAAVLLTGGDDESDDSEGGGSERTPVETVEALVQASEDGDCEAGMALMVNAENITCEQFTANADDYELKSAKEKSVDGDKAVVETEYESGDSSGTEDFPLTKVDGVWLVDFGGEDGDSGSSSAPEPGTTQVDPATGGSHPLQVMDDFTAAIKANDCEAAKALLLDPDAAECSEITRDDSENIEFASPSLVDDSTDRSTVSSEMTAGGSSVGTFTVELVKDAEGAWKIESWRY